MSTSLTSSGPSPPRIVVADESPIARAGLRAALEDGQMIVVAATPSAEATILVARDSRPDLIILSAALPGGALAVIDAVRRDLPRTEFIVMADVADDDFMFRTVTAGARGFLLGETDPARLPNAVAGVLGGEAAFPRRLVRAMADELARRHPRRQVIGPAGQRLTARELESLDAVAATGSAEGAAARLGVSHATIRSHVARAMRKLGAASRAEAVEIAVYGRHRGAPGVDDGSGNT